MFIHSDQDHHASMRPEADHETFGLCNFRYVQKGEYTTVEGRRGAARSATEQIDTTLQDEETRECT